jgi:hypothetical protein
MINGAPTYMIMSSSTNGPAAFSTISDALNRKFNVGCDTSGSSIYGIAGSHAYHVIGTYQIKSPSGAIVA